MSSESVSISTLIQKNAQQNTQYNWVGVLEFLHEQHKQVQYKDCEWALEKSQMQQKINELEGVVKGQERVITDLGKRCKMLEVALRQERLKYQQNGQVPDYLNQLLKENIENQSQIQNYQTIPKRKAKPYRPLLQKIIQEVGLQSIFSPPSSPKIEHSNRPSVMLTPNQNVTSIVQNSGRQSPTNMNSTSGFPTHSRSKSQNINEEQPQIVSKDPVQLQNTLRHHLDGVRDAYFFNNMTILATVSEDCQLKLWDYQNYQQQQNQIEPYLTLRDHTGPLFAIAGIEQRQKGMQNAIFSAGAEGAIKMWYFPLPDECDQLGQTEEFQQCRMTWQAHQDAIWQLKVNQQQNLLLSSAADSLIKLWPIQDSQIEPKQLYQFGQKNQYGHFIDSPTAIQWLQHNPNNFASGFMNSAILSIFDIENGRNIQNIKYLQENNVSAQINQLTQFQQQCLISSHDDGKLRIFDLQQSKLIQQIICGNEPITSAITNLSNTIIYIATGNVIKVWDTRRQQFIQELQGHQSKYDENIHNLVHHSSYNLFASLGADGQIKLFSSK
ncbi:unnamed protein product [Paramecium pentaurelia]|uniref:Striatin N-terminal domain-containing protein n=1 Tax=Paramecium pentaurelia TaxID=43138 RepID=A0A8S1TZL1_9CILI|nr:unnamed protein product [Paramecium pentaurelia]